MRGCSGNLTRPLESSCPLQCAIRSRHQICSNGVLEKETSRIGIASLPASRPFAPMTMLASRADEVEPEASLFSNTEVRG